jgi:hypothetical protein
MPMYVDDDYEGEVPDGFAVRSPMWLMDSFDARDHMPGVRPGGFAARDAARAARDEYIANLVDAWRRPQPAAKPDDNGAPGPGDIRAVEHRCLRDGEEAQRERDLAWTRYCTNLQNAWKINPRAAPGRGTHPPLRPVSVCGTK